jgi:hypothetical protein
MPNKRDIKAAEHEQRRSELNKLTTEEITEGIRGHRFGHGGQTIAKEILKERGRPEPRFNSGLQKI